MRFTRDDNEGYSADVATAASGGSTLPDKSPFNLFGIFPLGFRGTHINRLPFVRSGYDVVRIAAAIILLVAAGLKTHQLATEPIIGTSILDSRWLLMATVEFELFFGLWLLSNILPRATWMAAIGLFGMFTCISLYKALSGSASCGCFGRVEVNPWYTTALDLAVVISLMRWRPRQLPSPDCGRGAGGEGISVSFARFTAIAVLWLAIGLPVAIAMGSYTDTTLSDIGQIIGDGKIVVLEPEKWVGKRFPLLPFIEDISGSHMVNRPPLRERLLQGKWLIMLYHHGCPRCRDAILKLKLITREDTGRIDAAQFVLLELPPYESFNQPLHTTSLHELGRIKCGITWFAVTPLSFEIEDGKVISSHREQMRPDFVDDLTLQ